jgi:hypothetical protein
MRTALVALALCLGSPALAEVVAVPPLLDELADGVPPEEAVRALTALYATNDRRADATFVAYARHRVPQVRAAALPGAARVLREGDKLVLAGLLDPAPDVRAVAIRLTAERKWKKAVPQLVVLLGKGDAAAAPALGTLGDPALAKRLFEQAGKLPDDLLAQALAAMLQNPRYGKEKDYVELVQMIGRLPGTEPVTALAAFLGTQPETSPRDSVKAARAVIEARLGGGR